MAAAAAPQQLLRRRANNTYEYLGEDFEVNIHREGDAELQTTRVSQLNWSRYHEECSPIAEHLVGKTGYVVIPGYLAGDVQSMVTGKAKVGETKVAACYRESHEEIGLSVKDGRQIHEDGNRTYYWCDLSADPAPHAAAAVGDDNHKAKVCCVAFVANPEDVLHRHRIPNTDNDDAGVFVVVIPVAHYLQLLAAYNALPRRR